MSFIVTNQDTRSVVQVGLRLSIESFVSAIAFAELTIPHVEQVNRDWLQIDEVEVVELTVRHEEYVDWVTISPTIDCNEARAVAHTVGSRMFRAINTVVMTVENDSVYDHFHL